MRRILPLLLLLWGFGWSARAEAEVIRSFGVSMRAQKDTSLDITETIDYDFENAQKHGIYRRIPVVYSRNGGTYTIYLNVVSVTDGQGNNWRYDLSRQGRDLNIRIGDPDKTITGLHRYQLRYTVRRAINFFNGAPEIYWNATSFQTPCPIQSAYLRLYPPPGVNLNQIKTQCFAGSEGSTANGQIKVDPDNIVFYAYNLPPSNGLTIVAGLPAGSMVAPGFLTVLWWWLGDWWPVLVLPLLSLGLMTSLWYATGRDADGGLPAQVEWSPPKDLTPAEAGTLLDERCDMADIVSTLVDLAARGYLRIEEVKSEKFLFLQSTDYIFHQLPGNSNEVLKPHEKEFLEGIFSRSYGGSQVSLSSLKNEFYVHLPIIRTEIYRSLMQQGLFVSNPDNTRSAYIGWGSLLVFGGLIAGFALKEFLGTIAYGLGLGAAGLIVLAFSNAMPAKTAKGSRLLRECQGFQRFVQLAEKERIKKLITDDPTIFGRLLAYAMVLGVADEWADKFAGLMTTPPDWYTPADSWGVFSTHTFVNHLGHGMHSMGSTFESKPAPKGSSGGSGGSGFSGGSSGGGFGGGGTGSW